MTHAPTMLERAFALASSGTCATVADVREKLRAEGYPIRQLVGPVLMRQLRDLCSNAATPDPS